MIIRTVQAWCDARGCDNEISIPDDSTQPFHWLMEHGWTSVMFEGGYLTFCCSEHLPNIGDLKERRGLTSV